MPVKNLFRHQSYPTTPAIAPTFHRLEVTDGDLVDFTRLHSDLNIQNIICVHGTFVGDDPFAISETLRFVADDVPALQKPLTALAETLLEKTKPFTDGLTADIGNFTKDYCDRFQQLVGDDPVVQLLNPTWTSQNHHLARADLAVRLLCRLQELQPSAQEQVMLWGHSHAGNGFAILCNLLANDRASVAQFFEASVFRSEPHWQRARYILEGEASPHPFARGLRLAAFGTPVRYGWDPSGYRQLVHVLHHRNYASESPLRCYPMFPPQPLTDVVAATYGDWVQAFGIAGTDTPPSIAVEANRRLAELLECGLTAPEHGLDTRIILPERVRNTCARWKTGTRCHTDGTNLLVEYVPSGRRILGTLPIEDSLFGHGVATTIDWLPAHLTLLLITLLQAEANSHA